MTKMNVLERLLYSISLGLIYFLISACLFKFLLHEELWLVISICAGIAYAFGLFIAKSFDSILPNIKQYILFRVIVIILAIAITVAVTLIFNIDSDIIIFVLPAFIFAVVPYRP